MNKAIVLLACIILATAIRIEDYEVRDPEDSPRECMDKNCKAQEQDCARDRRCVETLQDCNTKCSHESSVSKCWDQCLADRKDPRSDAYIKCGNDHSCWQWNSTISIMKESKISETRRHCLDSHCRDEERACGQDRRCVETIQDCNTICEHNETISECWKDCLKRKKDPRADAFMGCGTKWHCWDYNSTINSKALVSLEGIDQKCIDSHCHKEDQSCDAKCKEVFNKIAEDCKSKEGKDLEKCWKDELAKAGNKNTENYAKCGAIHHCFTKNSPAPAKKPFHHNFKLVFITPEECIHEHCPKEEAACDTKCKSDLDDCKKKCGSKESCWKLCLAGKGDKKADDVAKCGADHHCL